MSDYLLLPRLDQLGVRRLLAAPQLLQRGSIADRMSEAVDSITYAPSGGSRASLDHLEVLRAGLLNIARNCGFPAEAPPVRKVSFDSSCGPWLIEQATVSGGEALRDDVWAFVTCCVAPDIALWRFEDAHPDRFRGGLRNTFQRLWLRAKALDRGRGVDERWHLVRTLSEDAAVQIVERPSVGADPVVARAIAEAWVKTAANIGASRMEAVTREAVRRIRMANEITCFPALEETDLIARFSRFFEVACRPKAAPEAPSR